MPTLYTAQTKAELERVLGIMKPYIDECACYDVVYSPKFGYLLIDLPGHDTICLLYTSPSPRDTR